MIYDVIILGGGASGLMAAGVASQRGLSVLVIDHAASAGAKIRVSGGGRCNFTNLAATAKNYVSQNSHFVRSALAQFTPADFMKLIEKHKVPYYPKEPGRFFVEGERTVASQRIVELLLAEAPLANFSWETEIQNITHEHGLFTAQTSRGLFQSRALVIALGALSFPTLEATDLGYQLAKQFGHKLVQQSPALVPLELPEGERQTNLAGVSCRASVTAPDGTQFTDDLLFTHKGLSGPVILQISNYWQPGDPLSIDLAPQIDVAQLLLEAKKKSPQASLIASLSAILPRRIVEAFVTETPLQSLSQQKLNAIAQTLQHWIIHPAKTGGYAVAEVTRGGIATDQISSQTLESKLVPGLYFCGECLDVTGWLGGFNLQWAWSSGFVVGEHV